MRMVLEALHIRVVHLLFCLCVQKACELNTMFYKPFGGIHEIYEFGALTL